MSRAPAVTVPGGTPPRPADSRLAPGANAHEADLRDAFVTLRPELLRLARQSLGSTHLAEETVQETFARAWRSRSQFDPEMGTLRTWLFSIERHLLVDLARAAARGSATPTDLNDVLEQPVPDNTDRAVSAWQVESALKKLGPKHRMVLVEIYFRGRTSKELAEVTGIPEGTIRSRLYYGLRSLRTCLEEVGWSQ